MTDDILNKAIGRRKQLMAELQQLDDFIRMYRNLAAMPVSKAEEPARLGRTDFIAAMREGRVRETIPSAAEAILRQRGRPMAVRELVDALAARGTPVGGKKPIINASSIFTRADNLVSISGRGWWIAGEPIPDDEASQDSSEEETAGSAGQAAPAAPPIQTKEDHMDPP